MVFLTPENTNKGQMLFISFKKACSKKVAGPRENSRPQDCLGACGLSTFYGSSVMRSKKPMVSSEVKCRILAFFFDGHLHILPFYIRFILTTV